MPMPWTYRHASKEWQAFLADAKDRMNLSSDNMAYTAIDAVFQVFRKRLTAGQGLAFASVLPSVPRAIFVKDWVPGEPPLPFLERTALIKEAQSIRPHHNLTPDNAIEATAYALRRSVSARELDRVLIQMSPEAIEFWHVTVDDPRALEQRII